MLRTVKTWLWTLWMTRGFEAMGALLAFFEPAIDRQAKREALGGLGKP
jgi:hypothetical protein